MLSTHKIQQLGESLYHALRRGQTIKPLTRCYPDITIEDAYHISRVMLGARESRDGEVVVGKKIGVTSPPVQKMLGVFQPDFGFLTNAMQVANGASIKIAGNLIQPKAEAEIAFRLKRDLVGPGVVEAQVLEATDYIAPCFEIVDSRIENWDIKIEDTVADNASCGVYVLGDEHLDATTLDLPSLSVVVSKNGTALSTGLGSAVQGNPLTAVAWLANTLGAFNIPLKAREIILSGSVVPLEPVGVGDRMHMEIEGLGSATVSFC